MDKQGEIIEGIVDGADDLKRELILKVAPDIKRAERVLRSAEMSLKGIKLVMDASRLLDESDRKLAIKLLEQSDLVLDVIGEMQKEYKRTMKEARKTVMYD